MSNNNVSKNASSGNFGGAKKQRLIAESRGIHDHSRDLDYSVSADIEDQITSKLTKNHISSSSAAATKGGGFTSEIKKLFKKA